jgi:hypothetical protein
MRRQSRFPGLFAVILVLLSSLPLRAMNMRSYDLTSLVFFSTDIVIANLSEDSQHNLIATVSETLYGSIQPGEKLDTLTGFLKPFFQPMEAGMSVVLFLDRRPQKYDYLYRDLAKSPFAIPPSGVYLIDTYGHVHAYSQTNNPGPYVAAGYGFSPGHQIPTQEEDIKLPSLDETRKDIAAAVKAVAAVRPLLEREPSRADAKALLMLADRTSSNSQNCNLRTAGAIAEKVSEQIRLLDDRELILEAHALAGDASYYLSGMSFINPPGRESPFGSDGEANRKLFAADRVRFLVAALADRKRPVPIRAAAFELLLDISSYTHPGGGYAVPLPFNGPAIASSADRLRGNARSILEDETEDTLLRSLAVKALSLGDADTLSAVRRVYVRTRSDEVRYAIEYAFFDASDELYATLQSLTGVATSIVRASRVSGCTVVTPGSILFHSEWHEPKEFTERLTVEVGPHTPVLTNIKTGQRTLLTATRMTGGSWTDTYGQADFELAPPPDLSTGRYMLALEYVFKGKIISTGHGLAVQISDSRAGKRLSLN